jgi:C-terminal processing protease CtpA/Prc
LISALNHRTCRVREVLEESPAADAGIEAGDIIASIDGVAAQNLTLMTISEMLEKPVTHELTIRRAGELKNILLTPKRLIYPLNSRVVTIAPSRAIRRCRPKLAPFERSRAVGGINSSERWG